jgi:AP-2 complex subunit alpha
MGDIIPAKCQDVAMYNIECIRAFSIVLKLNISYTYMGITFLHDLRFPVILLKFMEPVVLSLADFTSRWNQIGGSPRECVEEFTFSESIDVPSLMAGCNLGVVAGNNDPSSVVCVGVFTSTSLGKVGCLVRILTRDVDGV